MKTEQEIRWHIMVLEQSMINIIEKMNKEEVSISAAQYMLNAYREEVRILKWVLNEQP